VKIHVHECDSGGEHRGRERADEGDEGEESQEEPFAVLGEIEGHGGIILPFPAYDACVEVGDRYEFRLEALFFFFGSGCQLRYDAGDPACRDSMRRYSVQSFIFWRARPGRIPLVNINIYWR